MTVSHSPPIPQGAWAWFFDFDGTLASIASTPGKVRVDPRMRTVINTLRHESGGAVALITGRTLADVDRFFPHVRLAAAGQHGAERRSAAGKVTQHHFPSPRFDRAREQLAAVAADHAGLVMEDKGMSVALHYRLAPRLGSYVHRLARQVVVRLGGGYCVQPGKCVVEIRPIGRDKGTAIRDFMAERPFRGRVPIFMGDDVTDEFGFRMVNRLGGYSVKIGPGPTAARWRLRNVAAVRGWLEQGHPTLKAVR